MSDFLESEEALTIFVERWERGELPVEAWTHSAHVATCASYALRFDHETVFERMKTGIFHFNQSVGIPNSEDRGYHETLTRFWVGAVCDVIGSSSALTAIEKVRAAVSTLNSHHYVKDFYSFDVVKSREARKTWIPPDRLPV